MTRSGRIILLLLLALWAYGVYRLGTLWWGNEDYRYGWLVPALCLALFAERWNCRPTAQTPCARPGAFVLFGSVGLILLAAVIFLEVLPIWRLAGWMFAGGIVGLVLLSLYLWGGQSWATQLAFPVVFLLVAVPWPSVFEKPVIYELSRLDAALSVWLANGLGIPCLRQGTLIETGAGLLGVEDACSGIRSLQASLMVSLFLGELFRYNFGRRMIMLVAGLGLAFTGNVIRTLYLVRTCDRQGLAAVNQQHDQAGFTILGATLAGLLVLAWCLRPRAIPPRVQVTPATLDIQASVPDHKRETEGHVNCALPALLGLLCAIGLFEWGMDRWFSQGEKRFELAASWTFTLPTNNPAFAEEPIPEITRSILTYDEGKSAQWRDDRNRPWQLYYFRWLPAGNRYRASEINGAARGHAPDLCLRNAGMILQTNFGVEILETKGVRIQVTIERFLDQGRSLHVLAGYWEPDSADLHSGPRPRPSTSLGWQTAVRAIKNHDRGRGEKRVVKIGVWDMETDQEAQAALERCLLSAISP